MRTVDLMILWVWDTVMDVWTGWFSCLGYIDACCRCGQWQTLIISPRRDVQRLAQGFLREWSPRWPERVFERADVSLRRKWSRLSEIAQGPLYSLSSSHLGGGELAWARVILAWARPSSLSEWLGEDASWDVVFSVIGCLNCVYMGYCMMA